MQDHEVSMIFQDNRKTKRVSDAMALRIENADNAIGHAPLDTTPTHVVNLSLGGLRFEHERDLPLSQDLLLTMCLGPNRETVSLQAEVVSSVEEKGNSGNKRFKAHVKFKNVDQTAHNLLNQHIDHILNQTFQHCRQYNYKASA